METQTSTDFCGKTYKSWKAAGKATLFLFRFWQDQELPWEKLERIEVYKAWHLCDQREEAAGIGQAQRKQRLSKEKITNALPLSSSQGLPSFRQVMQLCAALHQVSMGKTPQLFGSILLPTQITGEKSRHWAPLLRTQLIFILLCLSCGVRLTNIPHLSLAKQQVPEKALRVRQHPKRHFQTNIMSSYTNIYLTSTKSSLKSSFLITSI